MGQKLLQGSLFGFQAQKKLFAAVEITEQDAGSRVFLTRGMVLLSCISNLKLTNSISFSHKAVFVDTDNVPALDSTVGSLIQNTAEAELVTQFTKALLDNGVTEEQIGIISLYRQQIKLLSNHLEDHKGVEILTADRSQGRDKDCILISLVRANPDNNVRVRIFRRRDVLKVVIQIGDLLKDWRRINVAFTRARSKLIIFGSRKTLNASPLLAEFFKLMESNRWVLTLPVGVNAIHNRVPLPSEARPSQSQSSGPKHASVEVGLLRSRPILRDVVNDLS